MKKILSAITAAILTFGTFSSSFSASAETAENKTPSGMAYEDIGSSIDSYIREREAGLASCAVSVFDRDGVIYEGYYGYADIENNIAADEDTVYEWASGSKMLVWTSVMQQWERGNIDFDADIREYLPEGFLTKLQYPDEKITMIDLMNHKAGFQESYYENQACGADELYDSLEDAVRTCECYQSFHVGEHTAYSNWGTALAAYIVEQTSGLDFVTYVDQNIFEPLGMEHSSIDPMQRDNKWVDDKRHELKCYERYADPKYNCDYGEGRAYVQLYPVGACMSTLGDYTRFGQALVSYDSPLFGNDSTYDEMFRAISFYGDTDIAKNCHGLWTQQHKVQTIGHGGNTNCTSNLEFDPVSGIGVAVLTNEAGETAFCNGIPAEIFGHLTDREGFTNFDGEGEDISGVYYSKRSVVDGAAKGMQYMAGVMPLSRNDDGTYSIKMFGIDFNDAIKFIPVGEHQYIYSSNGDEMFVYVKDGLYEMPYMDYELSSTGSAPTVVNYAFVLFGLICLLTLVIKLVALLIRKKRKGDKRYTKADKKILFQQMIFAVSGIIYAVFLFVPTGTPIYAFLAVSCILAAALGIISLANCTMLCYNTIKTDHPVSTAKKAKQFIWCVMCAAYSVFIIVMQLYCFWKL